MWVTYVHENAAVVHYCNAGDTHMPWRGVHGVLYYTHWCGFASKTNLFAQRFLTTKHTSFAISS